MTGSMITGNEETDPNSGQKMKPNLKISKKKHQLFSFTNIDKNNEISEGSGDLYKG